MIPPRAPSTERKQFAEPMSSSRGTSPNRRTIVMNKPLKKKNSKRASFAPEHSTAAARTYSHFRSRERSKGPNTSVHSREELDRRMPAGYQPNEVSSRQFSFEKLPDLSARIENSAAVYNQFGKRENPAQRRLKPKAPATHREEPETRPEVNYEKSSQSPFTTLSPNSHASGKSRTLSKKSTYNFCAVLSSQDGSAVPLSLYQPVRT